jgi:hypothetical protein
LRARKRHLKPVLVLWSPTGHQIMLEASSLRNFLAFAAAATLASCATPEQIAEYKRKFPPIHDMIQ